MGEKRNAEREAVIGAVGRLRAIRNAPAVFGREAPPEWLRRELDDLEMQFLKALGMGAGDD